MHATVFLSYTKSFVKYLLVNRVTMGVDVHLLSNAVGNDVLCYISTARHTLSKDNITLNCIGFYKSDVIVKAKDVIYSICDERAVTRKACNSHPNPNVADIVDIIDLLERKEDANKMMPDFVATKFNAFPPMNFEIIAGVMCSLRDEIASMKVELTQFRESNIRDIKSFDDMNCIKQDLADIKNHFNSGKVNGNAENLSEKPKKRDPKPSYATVTRDTKADDNLVVLDNPVRSNVRSSVAPKNIPKDPPSQRRRTESSNTRRQRPKTINVSGNRQQVSVLQGVEHIVDLFVGGCAMDCTMDVIKEHCSSIEAPLRNIEVLPSKTTRYKAFKISMSLRHRDILLTPDSWPIGVFVRKFYQPRQRRDDSDQK